ncbi:MAG: EamA family transporter [Clostridia bacterium]
MACLSAIFVGVTAVLMKVGVRNTNSHLATAIKTAVACLIAWAILFAFNQNSLLDNLTSKNWTFLILSGLSTGGAWLFQSSALKYGDASKVEPILKLSTIFTMVLAFLILQEEFTEGKAVGMVGILMGTILMLGIPRKAMLVDVTKKPDVAQNVNDIVDVKESNETISNKQNDISTTVEKVEDIKTNKNITPQNAIMFDYGWIVFAVLSSLCMAMTAIFGKLGIQDIPSSAANSIITTIVLIMSVGIVLFKHKTVDFKIDKKSLLFLLLSGITIGLSWVCYYTALKYGDASIVAPIESLSIVVSVVFAWTCLKEKVTMSSAGGLILILVGTIMTAIL